MAEARGHLSQQARHLLGVLVDGAVGHASPCHQQQLPPKLVLLSHKAVDLVRKEVESDSCLLKFLCGWCGWVV